MELIILERFKPQKSEQKNGIDRSRTQGLHQEWNCLFTYRLDNNVKTLYLNHTSSHPTYGQQGLRGLGTTHNDPLRSNFKYNRTCFLIHDDSARQNVHSDYRQKIFFWGRRLSMPGKKHCDPLETSQ